jgi:hypothetical protein
MSYAILFVDARVSRRHLIDGQLSGKYAFLVSNTQACQYGASIAGLRYDTMYLIHRCVNTTPSRHGKYMCAHIVAWASHLYRRSVWTKVEGRLVNHRALTYVR